METGTVVGLLTLAVMVLGLGFEVFRSRRDAKAMSEGVAKLAEVVKSNQQILQFVVSESSSNRGLAAQQLALQENRLKLDQLKLLGGAFRYLMESE